MPLIKAPTFKVLKIRENFSVDAATSEGDVFWIIENPPCNRPKCQIDNYFNEAESFSNVSLSIRMAAERGIIYVTVSSEPQKHLYDRPKHAINIERLQNRRFDYNPLVLLAQRSTIFYTVRGKKIYCPSLAKLEYLIEQTSVRKAKR